MIEVRHNVTHTMALVADEVLNGDFDIVQFNEGRSAGDLARDFETAHCDAGVVFQWDDEE